MSKPGAQEYFNNEIKRYAQWGVDFLKIDDLWDRWEGNGLNLVIDTAQKWTDKISEYHYPDGDMVPFGQLEGGRFSRFSDAEKRSLMTLYAMNKSPIMLGGRMNGYLGVSDDAEFTWVADIKDYDDLKYVINEDFININQNAVNVELVKESSTAPAWTSESSDGSERSMDRKGSSNCR